MNKESKFWNVAVKTMLMSMFATIISFMLNCLVIAVAEEQFKAGNAVLTRIITQVVGLFVEFVFIYGTIWDCGHNDQIQINLNLHKYSKFRGFLIGLASAIPYYIMAFMMMLMTFNLIPDITGLIRTLSSQFWGIYSFLLPVETGTQQVVDPEFAHSVATPIQAICAVFVPTIIPIISTIPYELGKKNVEIGERLVFVNNKKKK